MKIIERWKKSLYRKAVKHRLIAPQVIVLMDGGVCSQMHQYLLGRILVRSGKVVSINTPILDYYVYSSSVSHDLGERAYLDFNVYVRWFDDYIERNGLHEEFARELALFHIKNTQARLHWKKVKDVNKEMNRLMIGLGDYPEFWKLLSRREKKIVTTYRLSSLLGYWRLYYYNWKNKL